MLMIRLVENFCSILILLNTIYVNTVIGIFPTALHKLIIFLEDVLKHYLYFVHLSQLTIYLNLTLRVLYLTIISELAANNSIKDV